MKAKAWRLYGASDLRLEDVELESAGVEGVVVRIKKSRRVMVELPGMFAVTTNYIPVQDLEIL